MISVWCVALSLVIGQAPAGHSGIFNVREFGAVGDGKTLDTVAINRAVDACAAGGGGQVRLSPGRYLSGTVRLKSGVHLWLESGATLVGSQELDRYEALKPPAGTPESRFNPRWHRALILADGVEDISIEGPGTIDGAKVFDAQGEERMRGPHAILMASSRRIDIKGVTIRDAANYEIMLEGCDDVDVRGIRVTGGWDGVHFRGWPGRPCRRVTIADCQLLTGDDSIAGRYWEDTLITGCVLNSSCNGIRLIGPADRLVIHDCLFYGPGLYEHRSSKRNNMLAGLCLQPGAWDRTTGALDNVDISNVTMHNVTTPLFCMVKPGNTVGRVTITGMHATGVYFTACSVESWAETPIRQMALRDVTVEFVGGGKEASAPRSPGVDARPLPAWGLYARNVEDLRLENVRLTLQKDDPRAAIICDDVASLRIDGLRLPESTARPAVLNNVVKLSVRDSLPAISR